MLSARSVARESNAVHHRDEG